MFSQFFETWKVLLPNLRIWDLFDVLVVTFFVYHILGFLKGTRAFQIFIGFSFLAIFYWVADRFEVRTIRALLGSVFENWIFILVLLFHQDIRRALSQFGRASFFSREGALEQSQVIEEVVKSSVSLANKKIGALIVLEREADVSEFLEAGESVDAVLSRDLLTSIFIPVSPLHDGAVLVRRGRIIRAGCFLPLSLNPLISKSLGTRHRAALGITEETDAVSLVVSEELGTISFASGGKIVHELEGAQLRKLLFEAFGLTA